MKVRILNILVAGLFLFISMHSAGQAVLDEYYLKAVFLERFTRFVKYEKMDTTLNDSFRIVILGESPFKNYLDEIYSHQKIYNKPVKINYIRTPDQILDCDLLFICGDQGNQINKIVEENEGKSVLIIGDTPGFAKLGVMINMVVVNNKIRFEINPDAAEKNRLKIDRLLMSNAILIDGRK